MVSTPAVLPQWAIGYAELGGGGSSSSAAMEEVKALMFAAGVDAAESSHIGHDPRLQSWAGFARAEAVLQGFLIDFAKECSGCWFNQAGGRIGASRLGFILLIFSSGPQQQVTNFPCYHKASI
uniref:Uncharacterized protein n=1 Tax=Oryza nivara TaxID=4536 RepID=A0A0E0FLQ9_ORYNI